MFLFLFRLPTLDDIYYLCHQLGVLTQLQFPMGWKGLLHAALPLPSYLNRAIRQSWPLGLSVSSLFSLCSKLDQGCNCFFIDPFTKYYVNQLHGPKNANILPDTNFHGRSEQPHLGSAIPDGLQTPFVETHGIYSWERANELHSHVPSHRALLMCTTQGGNSPTYSWGHTLTYDKQEMPVCFSRLTLSWPSPIQFHRNIGCLGSDANFRKHTICSWVNFTPNLVTNTAWGVLGVPSNHGRRSARHLHQSTGNE